MQEQVCSCKCLKTDKASFVHDWKKVNSGFASLFVWLCVTENEVIKLWYNSGKLGFLGALEEMVADCY